jgi:hypothetical protein
MDSDDKERLLLRLGALRRAIEENDLPDEVLAAVYNELNRVDVLFPEGIKTHSILELKGLGKELWQGIDVDEYIRKERESWERPESWA